jgi:RHS repeat-associated protein
VYNPATNWVVGRSYDANGNEPGSYDHENRLRAAGNETYEYDPEGKRIVRNWLEGEAQEEKSELTFWGADGRRMGTYRYVAELQQWQMVGENLYFAGKLVRANGLAVTVDRLGSVVSGGRRYFPYGEERVPTANGQDKFATYYRDVNGLDYADQRYYASTSARFLTPDAAPAESTNPHSWNRYSYVRGDPINFNDPDGLLPASVSYGEGGFGCIPIGEFGYPGGLVDASSSCPPGMMIAYNRGIGGSYTLLQQIHDIFAPLGGIIEDWEYANRYGTAFNISLRPDLFNYMVASGTAVMTSPGVYAIGGVLVRIVVTAGAIASSPVVMTVAGLAAAGTVGYLIYKSGEVSRVIREVEQEEGCRNATAKDIERIQRDIESWKRSGGGRAGDRVPVDELKDIIRNVLCN